MQVEDDEQFLDSLNNSSRHKIESECGEYVYHVAIIDYLQQWNADKKCESLLKRVFKGRPKDLISCVPPESYQQRFISFI